MTDERKDEILCLYNLFLDQGYTHGKFVPVTVDEVAELVIDSDANAKDIYEIWKVIDKTQKEMADSLSEFLRLCFRDRPFYLDDTDEDTMLLRMYHKVESCGVTPQGKMYVIL